MNINIDNLDELISNIEKDQNSLEKLYEITKVDVYKFALSYLKNADDAEDVMQDTYINIHRYASLYNSQNKAMSWILKITKNLCLNKIKARKKTNDISDYEGELKENEKGYNVVLIKTILNDLSDEERKIFMLSTVENFKFKEIALILNLKLSTVLSKYNRAIKRVQKKYKEGNMV